MDTPLIKFGSYCTLVLLLILCTLRSDGKPMQLAAEFKTLQEMGNANHLDIPRIHQQNIHKMRQQHGIEQEHKVADNRVPGSILKKLHMPGIISFFLKHLEEYVFGGTDLKCDACKVGVSVVQVMFATNKSETEIVSVLIELCIKFKIETEKVCRSVIPEFKNEVLTVIDKVALSPKEICGLVLGGSCATPFDPLANWTVPLPDTPKPPVVQPRDPQPGAPKLRVLQLSDIHFDPQYMHKGNADCDEPLCCRKNSVGKKFRPAGFWGDYNNCDTPLWTLENMFKHLTNQKFDYILWTGDLPPHDVWNQSRADQVSKLDIIQRLFLKYFPDTPVFPALGNHESSPVNSFPPPFITGNNSIHWLYGELAKTWSAWLPPDTMANINKGGYFTLLIKKGLRLVSMNMNYCNTGNLWLYLNMTDPAGELEWLVQVLQEAEDNKEKVHIIGHIPPGTESCLKAWSWNYYRIINRYESTVVAQFFGHTHKDSFELFYDLEDKRRTTNMAYVSPSVTTYSFINPGYRVYEIDGEYENTSWTVLDHSTYILNLTEANLSNKTHWDLEYSAKAAYGLPNLLPSSWNKFVSKMTTNDTLFQVYYRYYYKSAPGHPPCTGNCKAAMLCDLKTGRSYDQTFCHPEEILAKAVHKEVPLC